VAETCKRCGADLGPGNQALTFTQYGCQHCRGKRPELLKRLGQEDEAHLNSKAESG
jgi:hypothetical protein